MPEHVDSLDCGCWGCVEESRLRSRAVDALGLLAKERRRVDLVELGQQVPVEYCLLDQLEQCLTNSSGGQKVGRARPGLPYDSVASEMWSTIWTELRNSVQALELSPAPKLGSPRSLALVLLEHVEGAPLEWLEAWVASWEWWVKAIQAHVSPERRTPIAGVCPADGCGQAEWWGYDEDGERVSAPVLMLTWADEQVAGLVCRCCFSSWSRGDLLELALVLNENLGKALAEPPGG